MPKLLYTGRWMFTLGMAGLALLCVINKDFIIGRPPAWSGSMDFNPALAYITSAIVFIAAFALLSKKWGRTGALVIALLVFLFSVLRCLAHFKIDALNAYKSMALMGGGLIVAASFYSPDEHKSLRKGFIIAGLVLLAAFFIMGGYAHFKYADFVTAFIPSYIPFRPFWAYACGIFLIAGGIGILIPATRKRAALLSGIMLSGWFLLLHIPRFLDNMNDRSDQMGLCESFTFAGILFCLAGMTAEDKKEPNEKRE